LPEALAEVRRALGMSREIRAQTANPEYRASIVKSLRPALDLEVELLRNRYDTLAQHGQLQAASVIARESLEAVDDFRAQGFEDWRAERLENQTDKTVPGLLRSSATLYRDMAERRFQLAARENRAGPLDPRALALREDIGRLRVQAGVLDAEIAARTSTTSALLYSASSNSASSDSASSRERSSSRARSERLKTFPSDSALVEYWLGSSTTPRATCITT
jgi:hypothetical protein